MGDTAKTGHMSEPPSAGGFILQMPGKLAEAKNLTQNSQLG